MKKALKIAGRAANYNARSPAFHGNEKLLEVQPHSEHLSELAAMALLALSDPAALKGKEDELKNLYTSASGSYGATSLPVVAHVQKLVEYATQN
jgi:hypothetical protein